MANFDVVVPKLGESVIEVTITRWLKNEGDTVQEDEPLVEIATDKVDTEISSPVTGILVKKNFAEGTLVPIGKVFALIKTPDGINVPDPPPVIEKTSVAKPPFVSVEIPGSPASFSVHDDSSGTRFYSPLVRSIAQQEGITFKELELITGTGKNDRLTKQDLLNYLKNREATGSQPPMPAPPIAVSPETQQQVVPGNDTMIEMDRIRQLIANHMVKSVQTSPHVTSFMEADMSKVVAWREKNKDKFQKRENEKLTFTPIFIDAIAKAVMDFPMMNVSVDNTKIIVHKNINIGMAVALPNFNLIVPVVHNAHQKNLLGIIKTVNDLAARARVSKLVPDDISGGSISLTNLGSFGTIMGTPIINQPQCAIVAVGAIKKRPVVVESPDGDSIAIRPLMIVSVTYDHRVIDGALGGQFLARLVHYLETFDANQAI